MAAAEAGLISGWPSVVPGDDIAEEDSLFGPGDANEFIVVLVQFIHGGSVETVVDRNNVQSLGVEAVLQLAESVVGRVCRQKTHCQCAAEFVSTQKTAPGARPDLDERDVDGEPGRLCFATIVFSEFGSFDRHRMFPI